MAKYRQTVLTAFRQVEDDLATPRILAHKAEQQETVVKSSQRYLTLARDRYNEDLTGSRKPTFIRDRSLRSLRGRNSRWNSQLIQSKAFGTRNVKNNPTVTELKKR